MTKPKPKNSNDATVVKSNSLIQAGYRLTLAEQHVLLAAISQIKKNDEPTDQTTYEITAASLGDLTDTTSRRAYQELAEAVERLWRREVRIEGGPNGDGTGPQGRRITMTRWVQDAIYRPDEGKVELRFAHSILPYLSMLQREFTQYQYRHIAQMRSTHGIRLYELLQQWRQQGEREIELDDLRRMFGVEGKYKPIKNLKARVIEPAVRDVNAYSDLYVRWGQRKRGRRVAAIQFVFEPQGAAISRALESKKPKKKQERLYTRRDLEADPSLAKPGETYEAALTRLNQQALPL